MRETEMIPMNALSYQMTTRPVQKKVLGSQDAGNAIPTSMDYVGPNESGVGSVALNVQMMETAEPITNAVHATAMTYLVPFTAFEQFNGSEEEAMRRYEGKESLITGNVEPFFNSNKYWNGTTVVTDTDASTWDTAGGNGRSDFYKTLGLHTQKTTINNSYVQAYNIVQNHRRRARSPQLAERNEFDHTIAEAFWPNSGNNMIVGDYDEAVNEGEVTLEGLTFKAPIRSTDNGIHAGGSSLRAPFSAFSGMTPIPTATKPDGTVAGQYAHEFDGIWAELTSGGNATMSLAEIAQGRLIAEYARKRANMSGQSEEYIIDLLMRGITPTSAVSRLPILVGMGKGIFSMNQRYATDSANLEDSLTNGMVNINYRCAVPRTKLGGVLVTQLEVAPEQVWERKKDYFLYTTDAGKLPNALRDHLQIEGGEGVKVVTKDHLDVNHSTPDAILGYAPLNFEHRVNDVRIGGKFYRPASDSTYVEERSRIWSAEAANPSLNTDMYLCTNVHKKVFADQVSDSLEYSVVSDFNLRTDIQFGDRLQETDATSDHEAITELSNE
jgi:hypothetical protein